MRTIATLARKVAVMAVLLPFLVTLGAPDAAAHIKWFCDFDVAATPQPLSGLLSADFGQLVAFTLLVLLVAGVLDGTAIGHALSRALDRVTAFVRGREDVLMRCVMGGFFVALWTSGGIMLTPELTTPSPVIPWIQLGIAIGLIWRHTMVLSALGMAYLFGLATYQYGLFHLMDYPLFLGIALYITLTALGRDLFGLRPLDVLRYAAAITLMWASVEKWAYPQWTYPLLAANPDMTLGFDVRFYMKAAGVVEFALAFALACSPLMRRFAALILMAMFVSAVVKFGKIDAIGHSPIIAAMLAIAADNAVAARRSPIFAPVSFAASLAATVIAYYGVHALLFHQVST